MPGKESSEGERDGGDSEGVENDPDLDVSLAVSTTRWLKETSIRWFFLVCGVVTILVLLGIFALLAAESYPAFKELGFLEFFTSDWNPTSSVEQQYGMMTLIVGTLLVTFGSMAIAIPIGIGCAAYISEVAHPIIREILKPTVEVLAAIPSVVVGFIGITVLGPLIADLFGISSGLTALNGSILLAFMAMPTIISLSEDAMNAVPVEYKEASLSLGASHWQTTWRTVIPSSLSGITAAIMLGMGRAVGETMAVLMATGNAPAMPSGYLDSVRTMTATIAIELGEVPFGSTHYHALFAVGLVLFLITFLINLIADLSIDRTQMQ